MSGCSYDECIRMTWARSRERESRDRETETGRMDFN